MAEDAKIIRLYHYMPAKYAEEFLRKDEIKLCDLTKSNDLCEFSPIIRAFHNNRKEISIALKGEELVASFKQRCPMLAFCCSTRISSSAMWGHYASNSTGVCLAFDFPVVGLHFQDGVVMGKIEGKDEIQFHKVKYTDERMIIPAEECIKGDGAIYRLLDSAMSYKSTDWSYEQECRLVFFVERGMDNVVASGDKYFAKGLRKYLSGIIMGPRSDLSDMYLRAVANEINESGKLDLLVDKLYMPYGVYRASIDSTLLKISVAGYEDFNFDLILPKNNFVNP